MGSSTDTAPTSGSSLDAGTQQPRTDGGNWPPKPPGGRMPLEQRAKIFIPFDPLKGFSEALREKERELESRHPDMTPLG